MQIQGRNFELNIGGVEISAREAGLFMFMHLADAFIQSDLQMPRMRKSLTIVVYRGWSPSNSRCVDGTGRTLLTQTWSNTEVFYCQPGPHQNYRMMHQIWKNLRSQKVCVISPSLGVLLPLCRVKPSPIW